MRKQPRRFNLVRKAHNQSAILPRTKVEIEWTRESIQGNYIILPARMDNRVRSRVKRPGAVKSIICFMDNFYLNECYLIGAHTGGLRRTRKSSVRITQTGLAESNNGSKIAGWWAELKKN